MIVHVFEHGYGIVSVQSPADDCELIRFEGCTETQSALDLALEWVLDNGHELAGVQAELFAEA